MKRALPIVFVVLAVLFPAVIAVAVLADERGGDQGSPTASSTSVPVRPEQKGARTAPRPGLQRFYDQRLDWSTCRDGDACATLEVPLDYRKPTGATIGIAVLRNAADGSRNAPDLLVNPGGPGAPGTDMAAAPVGSYFPATIHEHFNLIGFDPRGTGASDPVDCLSDREVDEMMAADPEPDNPREVTDTVKRADAFAAGCERRTGELFRHLSTHDAARDMDVLRAALGNAKMDYLGFSYGTKLGATYADLFPKRVGRMVLDGAVDPTLSSLDSSLGQAHGFQVALDAYVDHCVEGGGCYLGDTRAAALRRVSAFLDDIDTTPLVVGTRRLTAGTAFLGIIQPLYVRELWPALDDALKKALHGDGSGLLQWSDLYTSRKPGGGYEDNSSEAIAAINCDDDPTSVPAARIPALFPRFEKESPTFGRIFAWGMLGCRSLGPGKGAPKPDWHLDARGAAPIVVIGTTRDPATPLAWAQALASQLDSGVLITRDGDGHTGYNKGNSCVDDAVETYLIDGKAPSRDLTC